MEKITSTERVSSPVSITVADSLQTDGQKMAAVLALQLDQLIGASDNLNGKTEQFERKFDQAAELIEQIRAQKNVSHPMVNQFKTTFGKMQKLVTGGQKGTLTRAKRESFYGEDRADEDQRFSIE